MSVTSNTMTAIQPQAGGATVTNTALPVSPAGNTAGPPSSQVSTSQHNDFWRDLTTALTSIVGSDNGRAVIVNPGSGVVLVKAFPSDIRSVEQYLRITQLIIERQVMLEAKIIEVELNEEFQAGVNWSQFGGTNNRFAYGAAQPGTVLNTTNRAGFDSGDLAQSGAGRYWRQAPAYCPAWVVLLQRPSWVAGFSDLLFRAPTLRHC